MKPKVHSFKFTKNDLINALNKQGITNYSRQTLDEAMKEISLSKAVDYVKIFK